MDTEQISTVLKAFTKARLLVTTLAKTMDQHQLQRLERQSNMSLSNIQPFENFYHKKEKFKNFWNVLKITLR